MAKKKNKDYSYVREIMRAKFESLTEPSTSESKAS